MKRTTWPAPVGSSTRKALPRGGLFRTMDHLGPIRLEVGPEFDQSLEGVRMQLDRLRPELDRIRTEVPRALERIEAPKVRVEFGRGMEI